MDFNWDDLSGKLQYILDDEVAKGNECGCQLVIRHHGQIVIDLASGYTDTTRKQKVSRDHLFPIFSAGKTVLAALVWKMMENGLISSDTPIGAIWPEFNTPDKKEITFDHVLSHRAGMYLLPKEKPPLYDWEAMCRHLAKMSPRHEAGKKTHYHPLTFAYLAGHPLELLTGKTLKQLLTDEIISPIKAETSLVFGVDELLEEKVVPVDDSLILHRPAWEAATMNDPVIRRCTIPSFNGFASARGLAVFYSKLRGFLVKEETFDYVSGKLFRDPDDPVRDNEWTKFALGIVLNGPPENRRYYCGHGGAAGAEAFYMPDEDIAFAFVKNRLSSNHPDHPVRDRISDTLGISRRWW